MNKILIMESNPIYRIGDIIYRRFSWKKERSIILENPKYEGTLLFSYLRKLKNPFDEKRKIFRQIDKCLGLDSPQAFKESIEENLEKYKQYLLNNENTLYINIRAGDIIELNKNELFINNQKDLQYAIKTIMGKNTSIDKIRIITALHFGDKPNNKPKYRYQFSKESEQKNIKKIEKIINYLRNNICEDTQIEGFKEDETNEYNIDKDFYILSYAKNVILESFGGFTQAVQDARKLIINNKIEDFSKPRVYENKIYKNSIYELYGKVIKKRGFFAMCSFNLNEIIEAIKQNQKIVFSNCRMNNLIDSKKLNNLLFEEKEVDINKEIFININYILMSNKQFYRNGDDFKCQQLIEKYFNPKKEIKILKKYFVNELKIEKNNTIAVYYRGTDTTLDREITHYNIFVKNIKKIIMKNKNINKIFLQTDDKMFYDYFLSSDLDKEIVSIKCLEPIYSNVGQHFQIKENYVLHAQKMLASILLMSECELVVCNTSNVSRWINFYRDEELKFYQMKSNQIFPEING